MNEDLISNNFVDLIDKSLIKRNIKLLQVVLLLSCIYAVFGLVDWYGVFAAPPLHTGSSYYLHRIHPFVSLLLLCTGIYSVFYSVKAYKLVLSSFENEDPLIYNTANKIYYKLALLAIFTNTLSIVSILTRFSLR